MSAKWFLPFLHKQAIPYLFLLLAVFSNVTNMATAQNTTNAPVGDREALLAIKSMITDDPQGSMTSWNDSSMDFCQWRGVTCSPRHQRVAILDLSSGGLGGSLSPFIGNLSFLREISLYNNSLSGEIPTEVGRLPSLGLQ
ncbi:receptor kinase-like protein Xa21 [Tanacetum coccineum]